MIRNLLKDLHLFFIPEGRWRILGVQLLFTAFCLSLLFTRNHDLARKSYIFLPWNLFLAWIPFCLALALSFFARQKALRLLLPFLFFLWLLFLPNAPYLITDILHLKHRSGAPIWYDQLLLFACAWNGLFLGFHSLNEIHGTALRLFRSKILSGLLVLTSLFLSSFAIYLGRFLRWNSWDVFFNGTKLLADIQGILMADAKYKWAPSVTLVLTALLLLGYLSTPYVKKVEE